MEKVQRLVKWLEENEVKDSSVFSFSSKLKVQYSGSGYGIFYDSTSDFSRKEEVIKVPRSLLLNYLTCLKHIYHIKETLLHQKVTKHRVIDCAQYKSIALPVKFYIENRVNIDSWNVYSALNVTEIASLSSFQLVAMYLSIERSASSSFWKSFLDVLPELDDFVGVPVVWDLLQYKDGKNNPLTDLLQLSTQKRVKIQADKFNTDYNTVCELLRKSGINPIPFTKQEFLVSWLCINSRCLYMALPLELEKSESDCFTLCPLIDFINHSDNVFKNTASINDGITFDVVTSTENPNYKTSQSPVLELFFSYGAHTNSFLLTEYGFVLEENQWETIDVSDWIKDRFSAVQRDFIKENGYYDDYTMSHSEISFRSTVALSLLSSSQNSGDSQFRKVELLIQGLIDESQFESGNQELLNACLEEYIEDIEAKLSDKSAFKGVNDYIVTLIHRFYALQKRMCIKWIESFSKNEH